MPRIIVSVAWLISSEGEILAPAGVSRAETFQAGSEGQAL